MSCSDIISIILSVLSFILAVLSLVFIWITLKQNNKMLYANSRPYITIYFAYEENNSEMYVCVKNCGNSSAIIKSLVFEPDFSIRGLSIGEILINAMLAPRQQVHFLIPQKKEIMQNGPFQFDISIVYRDVNEPETDICEKYSVDLNYMLQVLNSEHSWSKLSKSENAICNLEKDVKAIMLSKM